MDRRAKMASVAAVTATLLTGGVAAAATTGALRSVNDGTAGSVRLVEHRGPTATPASGGALPGVGPDQFRTAANGTASSPARSAAAVAQVAAPSAAPGAVSNVGTVAAPAPAPTSGGSDKSDDGEPHGPPATQPPSVPTPPPTVSEPSPAPGGWDCSGSDDGLTEAQKQAREAACHADHADD